jgi:Xaa-Pro aminopeptidase
MLVQEKVKQARALLDEFAIDCWITFVRESEINGDPTLAFLLGSDVTWHSAFILTRQAGTAAIVGHYDRQTVEDTGAYDQVISFVQDFKQPFLDLMQKINPHQIAVNYSVGSEICDGLTHGMYLTLQEYLAEIGLVDRMISAEPLVSALRQRKMPVELAAIKGAIRHTEQIFDMVANYIRPGRTEKEIAAFMQAEVKKQGLDYAWAPNWCPAVFTGPNTAGAHYPPSKREVEPGHVVNMDFGLRCDGYCSDLQRSFYVLREGETEAPTEVQRGMATIVESIARAFAVIAPGAIGLEVDRACRDHVVAQGYEEFPAAVGHQVGRFAHDGTALLGPAWDKYSRKPYQPLEPGMVFTLEPRLSVPGHGVVTVEDMVVVTKNGAEYLSTPQTELILISP